MAVDRELFFARRLGLGLRPGESMSAPPREWAMDQLRSVPPLDFYDRDGTTLFERLYLPSAKPLENFEAACRVWETYRVASDKLEAQSRKLPAGEFDRRYTTEIWYPHMMVPRWRDCLVQTLTAVNGASTVFERFWMFWRNHFTVATPEAEIKLFYGPHTRNIRKRMTGTFAELLFDAIANPAMLMYLNNDTSTGPHARAARQETGNKDLNENLGRELLELHTLSPAGGYTQKDVVETALILTGWQMYAGAVTNGGHSEKIPYGTRFNSYRHEPGPRTVLGKTYKPKGDGANLLHELLDNLAVHPVTARHISFKLARHFIADEPPKECVDRITSKFLESGGDLIAIHSAVVEEIMVFAETYSKFTTPENWLLQSYRATGAPVPLDLPSVGAESIIFVYREMGQSYDECPQPNGYSDLKSDWLSKEMLDRRVRQGYRIGITARDLTVEQIGDYAERLAGADSPLVPLVKRAESRAIAVATLLASPQFLKI